MRPNSLISLLLILVLAPMVAFGSSKHKSMPATKPTPPPSHTVIGAISATSITVKTPHEEKTYKITSSTEITYDGQSTTVDHLQAGMRVDVTADSFDETVAATISANAAPVDPTPRPTPARKQP